MVGIAARRKGRTKAATKRRRAPGRPVAGAQDVRAQLLEAARELFLKYGYRAVSSRQVAAAAGANPAMIHYYFGNKHGLYTAMLEQAIAPAISQLGAMLEAPPSETSSVRMLETYMRTLAANPWIPGLLLREVFMPDGGFRAQFIRNFGARFAPRIADLVQHEAAGGQVRADLDPRLAVVTFLSLGLFPFLALPVWSKALGVSPTAELIDRLVAHTLKVYANGVRT
jgi:AcrR family transcriptional regulator